jgi:hypothetical protein
MDNPYPRTVVRPQILFGEHAVGWAVRLDEPIAQQNQTIGKSPCQREIVNRSDNSEALQLAQLINNLEDIDGMTDIEARRRLVEQQDVRFLGKGPRENSSLRFSS